MAHSHLSRSLAPPSPPGLYWKDIPDPFSPTEARKLQSSGLTPEGLPRPFDVKSQATLPARAMERDPGSKNKQTNRCDPYTMSQ